MTINAQFGFDYLPEAAANPEVPVNAALEMLALALAGEKVIDFESDADYELQASDPFDVQNDEWFYAVIKMTDDGTVLTQARSVIFPDIDALYGGPARRKFIFRNDTAQDLTVRGDSTSAVGVTVQAGDVAELYYNGEDVVAIVNPLP